MIKNTLRKIFLLFWNLMPLGLRVNLSEAIAENNIGYLDYDKGRVKIEAISSIILHRLRRSCQKEPGTVEWIEENFKQGDVFYDIGANIGAYSFVANVKTKGKIKIYAFEPGFSTYSQLCKNIYLNNYQDSIIPLNIALSSNTGFCDFVYQSLISGAAENKGLGNMITAQSRETKVFTQKVPVYSLDYLIKNMKLAPPVHIKVDVDGHEYAILLGAKETLQSPTMKTIQIEVDNDSKQQKQIILLLSKAGYDISKKNQHGEGSIFDYVFKKRK